jgi:hypothetical protein
MRRVGRFMAHHIKISLYDYKNYLPRNLPCGFAGSKPCLFSPVP